VPLSRSLGTLTSWDPLGHSRPVTGLLYLYLFHSRFNRFWINRRRHLVAYVTLPNFSPPDLFLIGQEADMMTQKEFPAPARIVSPVIKPTAWYFAEWAERSQIMCPAVCCITALFLDHLYVLNRLSRLWRVGTSEPHTLTCQSICYVPAELIHYASRLMDGNLAHVTLSCGFLINVLRGQYRILYIDR